MSTPPRRPAANAPRPAPRRDASSRRSKLRRRRLTAVGAVVGVLLAGGVGVAALSGSDERPAAAEAYVRAWGAGDYAAMYALLSDEVRQRLTLDRFAKLHEDALATATAERLAPSGAVEDRGDGLLRVPVTVRTRAFGTLRQAVDLPFADDGGTPRLDWARRLRFPGLRDGEELTASLTLPDRAALLTRDGQVLAEGPQRLPAAEVADIAPQVVGQVGPIPPERADELEAGGVPAGTPVGLSGLERALQDRLVGRPGGVLRAGARALATGEPRAADPVRTTIDPDVERAAITALAGRLGAVVAADPRTGQVLAFAGIAFSGLQPPGSTFKIITVAGALQDGVTKLSDTFPVETAATLEGVELQNANGESCGGTLTVSFAKSCNSVFAPMGVDLGADRLVETARAFGFDQPQELPGAAVPTLPDGSEIGDDLAVGSTAIGQGKVQATTLSMARVSGVIATGGRLPRFVLALDDRSGGPTDRRVIDARTAAEVRQLMVAAVRDGTGTLARVPGTTVAGKTGTAELQTTQQCENLNQAPPAPGAPAVAEECSQGPEDTTAWFTAFAPAGPRATPRVVVATMFPRNGAGGETAAPAAKGVLEAALKRDGR